MTLAQHHIYGCVFDFDGTIILSEHVHMRAWEDLAAETGLVLPANFLAESIGVSDQQLVDKLESAWAHKISGKEIYDRKRKFYLQRSKTECSLVPGVVEAIQKLGAEVPLAIATSSSMVELQPILEFFKLKSYFESLHTVETVRHPKPDPEIYVNACAAIKQKPQHCLAFEDSFAGSAAARAAGCRLVTLGTLFDPKLLGDAWFSLRDFSDKKFMEMFNS